MTDNRKPLTRRTALKGLATAGVAAAGGAAYLTRGASASSTADYGSVAISSDDGTVEYVAIYGDSVVTWNGFDTPAQFFDIDIDGLVYDKDVEANQTGWVDLHETGLVDLDENNDGDSQTWGNDETLSGSGTSGTIETAVGLDANGDHDSTIDWHVVGTDPDNYGLPSNRIDPAVLEADSDGGTKNFTIKIRSEYTWYDSSDNEIFAKTFTSTVDVTVNNEPATVSGSSGDGEDGATGA